MAVSAMWSHTRLLKLSSLIPSIVERKYQVQLPKQVVLGTLMMSVMLVMMAMMVMGTQKMIKRK